MPFDGPLAGRAVSALERIAVALERLATPDAAPGACPHPEEAKDHSRSTMGHVRWTCKDCGYTFEAATSAARG